MVWLSHGHRFDYPISSGLTIRLKRYRHRSEADFAKFFEESGLEWLRGVKAVAMDMNASFNKLVRRHMPWADIVYDRYHMQAQYGKDVLGVVRLQEARY